ncbi:hypothetical protein PUN28_017639 [Cardiocondyla obscurior]|uniref:Transmembrane protein n=1 Tax=Cardiocondyla obscurior TaxID=286306 RepID=A0AAW2EKL2_9HYME
MRAFIPGKKKKPRRRSKGLNFKSTVAEQKPGTTDARTNVDGNGGGGGGGGGRENRDFRLPAVLFRCGRQTGALSTCTREIRRDPDDFRWPVSGRAEGSIRIRHCGILNLFFFPFFPSFYFFLFLFFFLRRSPARPRLHTAVVIPKSIQVCKDRALKRRILSCERTVRTGFQNRSGGAFALSSACFIIATDSERDARKFKVEERMRRVF